MAKIIPAVGPMSGSVGANVYSHNKGGAYVRARKIPTNPTTSRQLQMRTILAQCSAAWKGLTSTNRSNWTNYAATKPQVDSLGQTFYLTGHQMFVAVNARRLYMGAAILTDPPTALDPAPLTSASVALAASGNATLTFAPALPTDSRIAIWQTVPTSGEADPNFAQARLRTVTAANATSPVTFTTWPAPTGSKTNFYLSVWSTYGLASPPIKSGNNRYA